MHERDELATRLQEQLALVAVLHKENQQLQTSARNPTEAGSTASEALRRQLEQELTVNKQLRARLESAEAAASVDDQLHRVSELQQLAQVRDELLKEAESQLKHATELANGSNDAVAALQASESTLKRRVLDLETELQLAKEQIENLKESVLAAASTSASSSDETGSASLQDSHSISVNPNPPAGDLSQSVTELHAIIASRDQRINELELRIRKNKQILSKAHQHITDSTKQLAEVRTELSVAKAAKEELHNRLHKLERDQQQIVDEAVREQTKLQLEKHISVLVKQQRELEADYVRPVFLFLFFFSVTFSSFKFCGFVFLRRLTRTVCVRLGASHT